MKKRKHKKSRKRSRSSSEDSPSSSSSGTDSEEERRRLKRKQKKREAKLAAKRAAKLEAKRAAKKAEKARLKQENVEDRAKRHELIKAEKTKLFYGYTNEENPWGDPNLTKQFVWRRKMDKEKAQGKSDSHSKASLVEKRKKTMEEVEKVRRRRKEREEEMEEMERLKAEESRLREMAQFGDWQKKEEDFHRYQAKVRSKIRLLEDRAKPIDMLAKNMLLFSGEAEDSGDEVDDGRCKYKGENTLNINHLEVELTMPYLIFHELDVNELKELQGDIKTYQELQGADKESFAGRFWGALAHVCADELKKAKQAVGEKDGRENIKGGMHESVRDEVEKMFGGRSVAYLNRMASQIGQRMENAKAGDGADPEYWEAVLNHLQVYQAKATLRELHQHMLQVQLDRLEKRRKQLAEEREARRAMGDLSEDEKETNQVHEEPAFEVDDSMEALAMEKEEKDKGLGDLEETLGLADEIALDKHIYWWNDKYRPRKPRYFNRVKTGYDWNKYNQTHYDHDNPPPKTVQGYKFNIFYPDLIDKTKAPKFVLEPAEDDKFAIIRFTAGPPYEDIAFKIVNRAWEYQRKRGFKCVFERGILSLFVNFKRHFYRR
mmetsp:Transcript_8572/g.11314  ORF Transcript_8572/g.11314 Transcript_8572/m.11314 type:complete len:603 (+) Transcript_8572:82-1890(+)